MENVVGIPPRRGPLGTIEPLDGAFFHEGFHDAVLAAVKADHGKPAAGCEMRRDRSERAREQVEFAVHRDPQPHEHARGWCA